MLGQLRYVAICCFKTLVMLFAAIPHKLLGQKAMQDLNTEICLGRGWMFDEKHLCVMLYSSVD
jgi:hypothetical protein